MPIIVPYLPADSGEDPIDNESDLRLRLSASLVVYFKFYVNLTSYSRVAFT